MSDITSEDNKNKEPLTKAEAVEMAKIVKTIREKVDKFGEGSVEVKNYIEKSDERMKVLDEKHENLVAEIKEKEKIEKELKERIEHLEQLGALKSNSEKKEKDIHLVQNAIFKKDWNKLVETHPAEAESYMKEMQNVLTYLGKDTPSEIKGFSNIVENYKAANDLLRTDIGELGGYLVQQMWSNRLREQLIEFSPVRRYATVETISGKSIVMPVEQGVPTANYEGEAEEGEDGTPNYVTNTLTPHRLTVNIPITWDMLNNSSYNISARIMNTGRKSFAQKEGSKFVGGNGIKEPLGFTQDSDVPLLTSGTATISFDDMIKLTGELKSGYNPMFCFNRRTLVHLRQLKDDSERYLWNPAFGDAGSGSPATINGYPYSSDFIDMDDYDAGAGYYPVLFADMREFYVVTDRADIIVIRDDVTQKKKAITEFCLMAWNHGQTVVKEAGILLKINS